ncbi:hypothetical protein [Bremerella volcania]|nr:hypothetical protein [Bremerella volcania]
MKAFPASEDRLFESLRPAVDNDMLKDIAMADNGHQWEEMYEQLRIIRDRGEIPDRFDWQLDEVLCLTRWSDPDKPNPPPFRSGPMGPKGFVTRLFVCTVLMRQEQTPREDWDSNVAISLASAARIGPDADDALARFLTYRLRQITNPDDRFYARLGILTIALRRGNQGITESDLETLADQLLDADTGSRGATSFDPEFPPPADFSIEQGFWEPTVAQLRDHALRVNPKLGEKLQLCALLVARD